VGVFFPQKMSRINFDKKMVWATFWAIISQSHLVTLAGRQGERTGGTNRSYVHTGAGWKKSKY
jgi:hypothetical protein